MSVINLAELARKKEDIRTPARVDYVEKPCPKCALGRMHATGRVAQPAPNVPPVFEHVCDKCKNVDVYGRQYPRVDFIKIEGKEEGESQ